MPIPAGSNASPEALKDHDGKVEGVAASVRRFYQSKTPYRIYHGSTNSTRSSKYNKANVVDTQGLSRVLAVDSAARTALVEPNVPMDQLVQATLAHGLVPPVVMEFPGITTGGGFSGTSAESSSFRHGIFDQTIAWVEMVLADGTIVAASQDENADLFRGAASAFGTLGVVTLLQVRLIPAEPYVDLRYQRVASVGDALKKFESAAQSADVHYLDAIMFSKSRGVVCIGRLTSTPPSGRSPQRFSRASDPWFYLHAERTMKQPGEEHADTIPIEDYLFRYDRGGFWAAKYSFGYFLMPFNRVTRWALDSFMHTRVMYHALHKSGFADHYVLQDVAVPYASAERLMAHVDETFGHYPIWLCPLRTAGEAPIFHGFRRGDAAGEQMFLNFGVWGPGPTDRRRFVAYNRALENTVRELGGLKCLYAHAYYDADEFWRIYDRAAYDALRAKYRADHLPTVYDKVKVDVDAEERLAASTLGRRTKARLRRVWPVAGLYGVLHTLFKSDYLMSRRRSK